MTSASLLRVSLLPLLALLLPPSLHAKTLALTAADNHIPLDVIVGDTITLDLASTPPGAMHLVATIAPDSALTAVSDSFTPSTQKNLLGTQHFRFNATRVGDAQLVIEFRAANNTSTVQPPSDAFSVPVHIASGKPSAGSSQPSLVGIFAGDLPCADCSAVRTRLTLYTKAPNDFTEAFFIRTTTYVDAPHGTTTFADRGVWTVLRGDATDPNATVYQLNPDSRGTEYLLRGHEGNTLTQLDPDLKTIATKANLTLTRLPAS